MKVAYNETPAESTGVSAPTQFKISASREAFRILSSGLYNDKKRAIVRELSCNAWDAHVQADKKDVPFEIHLPTSLEPFFGVKDQGVGLSHEGMIELYSTYFNSNKDETNDLIGALGLGSKSPFCYTDGFSVTSCFEGIKRVYSCFISDKGTPAIQLQYEDQTTDSNGLDVTFPVKKDDFWEFENVTKEVLEFFEPTPKVNTDIEIKRTEYLIKTETWGYRKEDGYSYSTRTRAVQGMVPYDVGTIDQSRMNTNQRSTLTMPLDLFFPIGQLSVAASREVLSNDDRTIENVLKKLDNVRNSVIEEIKRQIDVCKTSWEARLLIFNLIQQNAFNGLVNEAFNSKKLNQKYTNFDLNDVAPSVNQLDHLLLRPVLFSKSNRKNTASKTNIFYEKETIDNTLKASPNERKYFEVRFDVRSDAIFVLNDVGPNADKYVNYFLQESDHSNGISRAYLLIAREKETPVVDMITKGRDLIKELGEPPFRLVSQFKEFYDADKSVSMKPIVPYVKKLVMTFDEKQNLSSEREGYRVKGWTKAWKNSTTQPTGKKYYVIVDSREAQYNGEPLFEYAEDFLKFIGAVRASGVFSFTNEVLYGLPKDSPNIKDWEWVELTQLIFSELDTQMTEDKELEMSLLLSNFQLQGTFSRIIKHLNEDTTLINSQFKKFSEKYTIGAKAKRTSSLSALAIVISKATQLDKYKTKITWDFTKEWKILCDTYPMIVYASDSYSYDQKKLDACLDYIKLVDNQAVTNKEEEVYSNLILEEKNAVSF